MSDALIGLMGSVVVGILTLCGVIYQSRKNNDSILESIKHQSELSDKQLDAKLEVYRAVTDEKISELTREVRKHNNFAERMPVLEEKITALEKRVS